MRVDFSKNQIGYDVFGNRSRKTEYQTAGEMMMEKSKAILKNFLIVIYINIFFLGAELVAAFIESKPTKIILW